MADSIQIVWLRQDLRLADQPAFHHAADTGPVVPVFVLDDAAPGDHAHGGASRWWLHHSLESLGADLARLGSRIVLRRGDAVAELAAIAKETGASAVHALRHYEPWWRAAESNLAQSLPNGCELVLHDGSYLTAPDKIVSGSGKPYRIYTPFSRAVLGQMPPPEPLPAPVKLTAPQSWPASDDLAAWALLPTRLDWAAGFRETWKVGEAAAQVRLEHWAELVETYHDTRNLPGEDGSSRLSPHLHWGELSPATVWHRLAGAGVGRQTYARELIWRDYGASIIVQYPDYPRVPHKPGFAAMHRTGPQAAADFAAWRTGRTGYPIVDAGMRQLWRTGWMHNRVRMIAASFLVKHLLIDWRLGEQFYWDTLVDADYGNNGVNWQWIAGTGVDASQFVRIMAPLLQSEKFDAAGYIRENVPELAHLPDAEIHDPADERRGSYPAKLIGHREARERALAAYRRFKGTSPSR
ncbi:cryptochrome/photolyase family protein [Qipengyuania sediminis]|uniref:cryptochrome/photolyase family protein n=1 Tax=Qipengyuania sediminis TaxID=1532023 RepID=UPI0010599C4E|nr:deoxyribodipyrimidine photo-lyase [Qipengyuania sediminis]